MPPASTTVRLAGIGLATATFVLAPTRAVHGKVNFSKFTISATSTFNIVIRSLDPKGTSLNLVGNHCQTSTPVSLTFSGPFQVIGQSTYTGTYTIPPLANCELLTTVLNTMVPGPGNAFSATFSPA